MKKNVPDLAEVYNLLDQDYSQRSLIPVSNAFAFNVATSDGHNATVNAAQSAYPTRQNRPMCSHFGYSGHTIDKCYKVHGYPPGVKHKVKPSNDRQSHFEKHQSYPPKPVVANLTLNDTIAPSDNACIVNSLTKDQIQGVIKYFNSQLNTSSGVHSSCIPSTSGGIISTLSGSYQGIDDWSG